MTFVEKLVYLRERRGMSQEELAEKLDVTRQTISNWENDKVKIDVDKAIEICQLFDVDLNSLFLSSDTSQLIQPKSAENNGELRPSKKLILLTVISCVMLLVTVALLILSAILLSQSFNNRLEPSITSTFTNRDGFIALLVGSSISAAVSAILLIFCCKQLFSHKTDISKRSK